MARAKKRPKKPSTADRRRAQAELQLDRRRILLRNIPLMLGLFATYLLTIGPLRAQAAAGHLPFTTAISYALVGIMGVIGSLMVHQRVWSTRLAAAADTKGSRLSYLLAETIVYLLGGVGIGLLMMALLIIILRVTGG